MTAVIHAVSAALLHFLWQGLLAVSILRVVLAMMKRQPARLRYLVNCAVLGCMTAAPLVTAWMLYSAPPVWNAHSATAAVTPLAASPLPPVPTSLPAVFELMEKWAFPLWLAGVLVFAVRLIWMCRVAARLRREGTPPAPSLSETVARLARRMGVDRPLRVLISTLSESPSVAGWLRPVILVPAATLLNLSTEQLETVLAHELAHIRRHDYLVNLLQSLAETLLFYHPAIWWTSSRIREERELCCDDLVVEVCGDSVGYARALARLERLRVSPAGAVLSSTGGSLVYRVRRLTGTLPEQAPSKLPAVFALILALACFAWNLPWAHGQSQNGRETDVRRDELWFDTVKFGDMPLNVRGLGTIASAGKAELKIPGTQAGFIQVGQDVTIDTRQGVMLNGKVSRRDAYEVNRLLGVTVDLQAAAPQFVGATIDGSIHISTLQNVVYVGRPVFGQSNTTSSLFKVNANGIHATRVKVSFGVAGVNVIQIVEGLQPGDRVIVSDMSKYDDYARLTLQ